MKKSVLLLLVLFAVKGSAQMDTIYTNSEKIACIVKEITPDAVKFSYPNEELLNSVYKNTIQKIVLKSGRVQTFAEATSYKTVTGAEDYENVTLTEVESEVKGLFKLGEASSKAKGTTGFSSMEKVKQRAYKKMKIMGAMMGANIIYLTQNITTGNEPGGKYQGAKSTETNMAGVAYSNKLPSYDEFNNLIGTKTTFRAFENIKLSSGGDDMKKSSSDANIQISRIYNESGLIMLDAKVDGVKETTFRVISFTNEHFTIVYHDSNIFNNQIYNLKVKI